MRGGEEGEEEEEEEGVQEADDGSLSLVSFYSIWCHPMQ